MKRRHAHGRGGLRVEALGGEQLLERELLASAQPADHLREPRRGHAGVDEVRRQYRPPLIQAGQPCLVVAGGVRGVEHVAVGIVLDLKASRVDVVAEQLRAEDVPADAPRLHPAAGLQPLCAAAERLHVGRLEGGVDVAVLGRGRHHDGVVIGGELAAVEAHERHHRFAQLPEHLDVGGDESQRLHVPAGVAPELLAAEHHVPQAPHPRCAQCRGARHVDANGIGEGVDRHRRRRLAKRRALDAVDHLDDQSRGIAQAETRPPPGSPRSSTLPPSAAARLRSAVSPADLDGEADELVVRARLYY